MNRKLRKLIRDPKQFFLDSNVSRPILRFCGVKKPADFSCANRTAIQQAALAPTATAIIAKPIIVRGFELFDLVGEAWENEDSDKPVLIVFGINPWKRDFISDFLSDYRVAYVRGKTPWRKLDPELRLLQLHAFVFWGMQGEMNEINFAEENSVPIWRMEDGFLRSVALGSQHVPALSLAIDKTGIYFNSRTPSDLEKLIESTDFKNSSGLIERAEKCISMIIALRLSKYNEPVTAKHEFLALPHQYKILVVGQVEDDASIIYGCTTRMNNNDLVRAARKEHPDADIFYRPHPDVAGGYRSEHSDPKEIADICTLLTGGFSLPHLLDGVDHIYTMTSLVGFEALLRGINVTTFGVPFYAGWGLTDDRQFVDRRDAMRSIAELFAAAYILYPTYCIGRLGDHAQIEHAILALHLERSGIESTAATVLASAHSWDVIDLDFCECLLGNFNNYSDFLGPAQYLLENHEIWRMLSTMDSRDFQLSSHLVNIALEGTDDQLIFTRILACARMEDQAEVLAPLSRINVDKFEVKNARDFVKCLVLVNKFDEAESLLNQKLTAISDSFQVEEFLTLMDAFTFLHAEQGKFGRKPKDAMALCLYYNQHLSLLFNHPKFPGAFSRILAHLAHHRMCDEMKKLSEGVIALSCGVNDFVKLADLGLILVKNFTAQTKRPELYPHEKFIYAENVFQRIEARCHCFYHDGKSGMPSAIKMSLVQMAFALENSEGINTYTKLIYQGYKKIPPVKNDLNRFKATVSAHFNFMARGKRYAESRKFLAEIKNCLPEEYYLNLVSSAYIYERNYQKAESLCHILLKKYKNNSYRRKLATIFENQGKLELAVAWLKAAQNYAQSKDTEAARRELEVIEVEMARADFLRQAASILAHVPQPKIPKGVVFVTSFGCLNSISMMTPVLLEIKRRGYAVIQVDEGMLVNEPTGIEWIDRHAGRINRVLHSDVDLMAGLGNEWQVSWSEKKVIADGINFYQGIFEIMTQKLRAFNFDINDKNVFKWLRYYLIRSDAALTACKSIRDSVARRGMPVRFINCGSHSAPFSVYRTFCERYADRYDIGFIHMGPAYENYYSNLKSKIATTVSLENLTKYPLYRLPFLARPDLFEHWIKQDGLYEKYRNDIDGFLNHDRVGRGISGAEITVYEKKIIAAKSAGQKVIGVYGKILCDMAVPFDGGPGHENIVDWLRHTVKLAKKTHNLIVLKPHPHELRPEIARDLNEYWLDLVRDLDLPENVLMLPHSGFNNQDLVQYLDLAVLWNGTSSLELCAQGIPVLMASHFGKYDYPVELLYPESRDDYEKIICAEVWEKPSKLIMERAALLLKYMGTEDVCVPFKYSHRPITNDSVGVPYWHMPEVERLLRDGDPHISKLADKFFS